MPGFDQSNWETDSFPPQAVSKGDMNSAKFGKCLMRVLYRPFQALTCLTVLSWSGDVSSRDLMLWSDGRTSLDPVSKYLGIV